jgi:hypothetical protein
LGSWIRKLEEKIPDMFSRLKDFWRKIVETNGAGIDQFMKDHLVNLHSRFYKYFSEAVSDKMDHGSIPC